MAHFAQINKQKMVVEVLVIGNEQVDDLPFPDSEPVGQEFIASLGIEGKWLQTSYNGNFRAIYAGIGDYFDESIGEYGAFVEPVIEQ
jgi:hypothetical protein